ncbi:Protein of unknown function [Treponema bryantii]|uniref:Cell division protein ZapB n=1 Tax=Treponema bryantii TaxID=163 RepID=A0A1I3JGN0_9SPIR|nr:cell division protein ZapB [Treponema bryantii]SFI59316.1 Protein of unknown function [Treponema bryantii]
MISLDQVYLLEQKVESAVAKIQQLQAENDALRNKCAELTNALSVKSEQLTSFESDQSQIENGIKKALDRLNSIENSVLKTAAQINQDGQAAKPAAQAPVTPQPAVQNTPAPQAETPKPVQAPVQSTPSFNTMETVPQTQVNKEPEETTENIPDQIFEEEIDTQEDDNHDGLGFDIF